MNLPNKTQTYKGDTMFNRIAICDAYHMFATLYHSGQYSTEYAIFSRLAKLNYTPGLGAQSHDPNQLSEEAREVFDHLVERYETPERARIERLQSKVRRLANHILEAAQHDAQNTAKNSTDWQIRAVLEDIQLHYNGYAEPGYTDPECGVIATGNWNDIINWANNQRSNISNVPSRIAKLFSKLGIPTEWSDEWCECTECGKIVRTQGDHMSWQPSYKLGEGELLCHECDDSEETDE